MDARIHRGLVNPVDFLNRLDACTVPLLADGAMGTMLHAGGVAFSVCFDALNLTEPALVARVHREYIDAASEIILANTFGANRYKLAEHGLVDRVAEINRAGVDLARRSVPASFREVLVAGDVGPLGVRLVPYGRVQKAQARAAFAEQIEAPADAGADLIVIETLTDLQETLAGFLPCGRLCAHAAKMATVHRIEGAPGIRWILGARMLPNARLFGQVL